MRTRHLGVPDLGPVHESLADHGDHRRLGEELARVFPEDPAAADGVGGLHHPDVVALDLELFVLLVEALDEAVAPEILLDDLGQVLVIGQDAAALHLILEGVDERLDAETEGDVETLLERLGVFVAFAKVQVNLVTHVVGDRLVRADLFQERKQDAIELDTQLLVDALLHLRNRRLHFLLGHVGVEPLAELLLPALSKDR